MGIELNKLIDDVTNNEFVRNLFNNPIYVALLIVVLIIVIIYFFFREIVSKDRPFWLNMFRSGIYITLSTVLVLFLHNKSVEQEYEKYYEQRGIDSTVQATTGAYSEIAPELITGGSMNNDIVGILKSPNLVAVDTDVNASNSSDNSGLSIVTDKHPLTSI